MICALAVGFTSVCLVWQERDFIARAIRTKAQVIALAPLGERGQLVPIVEFLDENGRMVKKQAQRFLSLFHI